MAHSIDMVMDFQYGSTGKGLIAGWLAKRNNYDTIVCAFGTNAGHTYIDASRDLHVMTQQLPTGISAPGPANILLGPGALIHTQTLLDELERYERHMLNKNLMIHPHACVVEDYHAAREMAMGMTKMGSTAKGVGAAAMERMHRDINNPNIAASRWVGGPLEKYVCTLRQYAEMLDDSESILVEGAQGFSLSMYHGQYPYVTSRDVTPWQIAADCGLPFKWAPYIKVIGTLRTHPIRVNNRDGSSGPHYPDQRELTWEELGIEPELTTVTKLPRRVFTFSQQQYAEAAWHCGGYWNTRLFLNFANYLPDTESIGALARAIEEPRDLLLNSPKVEWIGMGPDDNDVLHKDS